MPYLISIFLLFIIAPAFSQDTLREGWTTIYNPLSGEKEIETFYNKGQQAEVKKYYGKDGTIDRIIYKKNRCPYKAQYFDKNGKIVLTINNKKEIQKREGNWPLECPE